MSVIRSAYNQLPEHWKPKARRVKRLFGRAVRDQESRRADWGRGYFAFQMGEKEDTFRSIAYFCHVNRPMRGYYMEFGCHEANTMRMAWKHGRYLFDWHYLAFDSFEGFPEIADIDKQEIWAPGKCATGEAEFRRVVTAAGMPEDRLTTIKGFYDASLTPELKSRLLPTKAVVCYVDCDLYLSTVPVLDFIVDFLQIGTVIVFDDWNCFWGDPERGERKAWAEFLAKHPDLKFERFVDKTMSASFICVGGV
jgi:hypothetical protein